jgi:hypothetical protein
VVHYRYLSIDVISAYVTRALLRDDACGDITVLVKARSGRVDPPNSTLSAAAACCQPGNGDHAHGFSKQMNGTCSVTMGDCIGD